ncbi:subunit length determinant protein [Neolewinella xylanilytica]|uniref:Subunit length determinant protein n=1 Tax=Neolewinella xylanilytica TaxID=1514080 RepID=A0A2S6I8K5_9BACT|nr:GNVR domain-containing protein [Neolewinella xylanilytica]PPK87837.1 subunit length determinant protein [Neolewinella xylanilytica]
MQEQLSILRPYIRGLPIIVVAMVAGLLVAKKYLSYTTPMYESTTKIKLADLDQGVTGNNLFKDFDVFASTGKIAMEIEVLKSQILVHQTLEKLDFDEELSRVGKVKTSELYTDKPFLHRLTVHDPDYYDRDWMIQVTDSLHYTVQLPETTEVFSGVFGDTLHLRSVASLYLVHNTELLSKRPDLALRGTYQLHKYSMDRLTGKVAGTLDVVAVDKDVAIIRIIYKNNVPEKAAMLTNELARTYIEDYIQDKFRVADITAEFLDQQITKVYDELAQTEREIQSYRDRNEIINIRMQTETDLRQVSQMKIQQTNARMSLEAINELYDYIQSGKDNFLELAPNFEAFTDLLSTEMVKNIKQLQAERQDLLLVYREDHELVRTVEEKIDFYVDYFVESINNTRRNLQTKYDKLTRDIEEAERAFEGLPERERTLTTLDREFGLQQQSYVFLNEKRIEAEIAKAAKHSFHRIIQEADVPEKPVSPNRPIIIIVSSLLGMFGAVIFIFLVNASKARVNDITSVEKHTDIPIAYTTPHLKTEEAAAAYFKNEVFKLDMKGMLAPHSSLVYSAFHRNHGVRYQLQQLGEVFLREGRNFCVLTFDGEHTFRLPAEHLRVMHEEEVSRHTFAELLSWYRQLCTDYDLVLVDNFNLRDNAKSLLFMGLADQNICVLDTRKTRLRTLGELNLLRAKHGIDHLRIVVNNDNYSPSLLHEGIWMVRKAIAYLKKWRS